jgi:hypothetical protein
MSFIEEFFSSELNPLDKWEIYKIGTREHLVWTSDRYA